MQMDFKRIRKESASLDFALQGRNQSFVDTFWLLPMMAEVGREKLYFIPLALLGETHQKNT